MSAGETIRRLRTERELTQGQLAIKSDVSQARISCYERGGCDPNVKTFEKILNALGYQLVARKMKPSEGSENDNGAD